MKYTITLEYESNEQFLAKLRAIASKLGYRLVAAAPERLTVGALAAHLGRRVTTVSRSLNRPSCPAFTCRRGKRKIIWLEMNESLLAYLTDPPSRPKRTA